MQRKRRSYRVPKAAANCVLHRQTFGISTTGSHVPWVGLLLIVPLHQLTLCSCIHAVTMRSNGAGPTQ